MALPKLQSSAWIAVWDSDEPPPLPGSVEVPRPLAPDVLDAGVVVGVPTTSGHDHPGCQIDKLIVLNLKLNW